jgi:general secretion pathway protein M
VSETLTRPESRPKTGGGRRLSACLLAWALLILAPVALGLTVAWPWLERISALSEDIDRARDQLVRYQRLVGTLPGLRAELEAVNNNQDFKAFYFDAQTPALAGATLQQKVQDIIKAAGSRLISTQILPATPSEQPPTVRVRIQLQGSTEQLLDVLYQLEQSRPFLFVDQVSVRSMVQPERSATNDRNRQVRRLPIKPETEDLTVRLDIFGYALGGA